MGDVESPENFPESRLLKQQDFTSYWTHLYSQIKHLADAGFTAVDKERNPDDLLHRQAMSQGMQATVSGFFM